MNNDKVRCKNMMIAYNNFCPTTFCGWRESTLITMSTQSTQIATVLCLTNYEISLWQYHYLQIWSQHPSKPYLSLKDLFSLISIPYVNIFQEFGSVYDKITADNIITVVWLFVFLNIDNLTRILLSIHGFQSNMSITYHQCVDFFHSLNPTYTEDKLVYEWLNQHNQNKLIKIDDIMIILSYSHCLTYYIETLKESLVNQFIGKHDYLKILFRIRYFNEMYYRKVFRVPPKEGVASKLNRLLFTKKPPPYFSDYRSYNVNYKRMLARLVFEMRQEFGYSKRLKAPSVPQIYARGSPQITNRASQQFLNIISKQYIKSAE